MKLVAFFLSIIQVFLSFLLHNDLIEIEILQWLISIFYIPLYLVLLCFGGVFESLLGVGLLKSGMIFPYLENELWLAGVPIMYPVNFFLLKLAGRFQLRA
ncbi:hypothetical protein LRP50_24125 [Enterovibrio sp. ZSDZ42]|uniref:Rod shape-determining protein MreD n=1 Tax=Enterovibrio gelatinilyticus TaxID=2899819 RepID=A0ABT5R8C5_9GAMM|nr:hypothetical protein [Enterovibrio sp. ZSDZ42]MDD1796214.1 hypothetical protein [Enterovibrio sp. ZSDZ42]